ncbi:hypothetical protein M378DRAFT_182211 [Amanita muscaria Koide BX008]|uniref:Uncharacterized protein n=1 Tax=Amanita muscaria (strain Koide BX008) TaxID=946122 RepID=A0A0C2WG00_AMAMK|nr:hypothetical protein M378DRAFT_182211 [Amanita muscaria Koide BX008]
MTRQTWTSDEEHDWLISLVPMFREAQQSKKTSTFWPKVYEEWGHTFKFPLPTADEISAANGDAEAAALESERLCRSVLVTKKEVIPVIKAMKCPAPWQAYQKTYWMKLKDIVDVAYKEHLQNLSNGDKVKPKIQIQTEVAHREYENETEEVKAEIEEYVKSLKDSNKEESDEQRAMRLQQINTVLYETSSKETDEGLCFAEMVGAKEWESLIVKWDEFLHQVLPQKATVTTRCNPPVDVCIHVIRYEVSTPAAGPQQCEYEQTKARNIAENKKLLQNMFRDSIWVPLATSVDAAHAPVTADNPTPDISCPTSELDDMTSRSFGPGTEEVNCDAANSGTEPDMSTPLPRPAEIASSKPDSPAVPCSGPELNDDGAPVAPAAATSDAVSAVLSDQTNNTKSGSDIPTIDSFSASGYITDERSFTKLLNQCDAKNWRALVQKWIEFEKGIQNFGALPTKFRPQQVAWWMKNSRKLSRFPKIIKPADYILSWRQWWLSLQPDWRVKDATWPPSHEIPVGCHLSNVAYAGPNGFFLVLLTLSWWGRLVVDGLVDSAEFEMAIDDVLWVLSYIRPLDEDGADVPCPKRACTSA